MQIFYQFIYQSTVNRIIRNLLKLIPGLPEKLKIHPSGTVDVELSNGKSIQLNTNQTCHVTAFVFWKGSSAYEYTDVFISLFSKIRTFFDVGSNIGYYSIIAGKINADLRVYAFDPSPGPFLYLLENVEINGVKNVKPFQMALSDENGTFSFHVPFMTKYPYLKHNTLGGSGHLSHVRDNPFPYKVEVTAQKLDSFISDNNIEGIDLIKLDVEEAEHLVIAGGRQSISKFRPIVVCEIFSTEMLQLIQKEIISLGYKAFRSESAFLFPEELTDSSEVKQIENFFFVPEEKIGLVEEFIR